MRELTYQCKFCDDVSSCEDCPANKTYRVAVAGLDEVPAFLDADGVRIVEYYFTVSEMALIEEKQKGGSAPYRAHSVKDRLTLGVIGSEGELHEAEKVLEVGRKLEEAGFEYFVV